MFKYIILIAFISFNSLFAEDWEILNKVDGVPHWGFDINNSGVAVMCGMRNCSISDDFGKSWNKHYAGTDAILNFAGFAPDGGIMVTGHKGTIVYFAKSGSKFEDRSAEPVYNLKKFIFTNQQNGFMISEGYYLLKTSDGGKNWEVEKIFREYPFLKDIMNIGNTLYLATDNRDTSVIYKSVDNGKNWDIISIFPSENIQCIKNINGKIWISGAGGLFANSDDGGKNWNWLNPKTKLYLSNFEVIGSKIWIYASWDKERIIFFSDNSGKSWKEYDKTLSNDWPGKLKILGDELYIIEGYNSTVKRKNISK